MHSFFSKKITSSNSRTIIGCIAVVLFIISLYMVLEIWSFQVFTSESLENIEKARIELISTKKKNADAFVKRRDSEKGNHNYADINGNFFLIKEGNVLSARPLANGNVKLIPILDLSYPIKSVTMNRVRTGFVFVGERKPSTNTLLDNAIGGDIIGYFDLATGAANTMYQDDRANYSPLSEIPFFSPDGLTIYFATDQIWVAPIDGIAEKLWKDFVLPPRSNCSAHVRDISQSGRYLVSAVDCTNEGGPTFITDLVSQKDIDILPGVPENGVYYCGFTPDDRYITYSIDVGTGIRKLQIVDIRKGMPKRNTIVEKKLTSIHDYDAYLDCESIVAYSYEKVTSSDEAMRDKAQRFEWNGAINSTLWYHPTTDSVSAEVTRFDILAFTRNYSHIEQIKK